MTNIPVDGLASKAAGREVETPVGASMDLREERISARAGDRQPEGSDLGIQAGRSIEITREALEERLREIATLPAETQMREARKLSTELFGSREAAVHFVDQLSKQLLEGDWETSTNFNPNGFFKMGLAKVDGVALRLHFNSKTVDIPEGGRVEENVHDHRWCFVSTLLTGRFDHEIYKPADEGEPGAVKLHQYTYAPRGGKEVFEMGYEGEAHLKPIRMITPEPFKPFSLGATVIHKAGYPLQDTEMTVTAVITLENRGREFNYVWADDQIHGEITKSSGTTPTPKCDESVQLRLLLELADTLKAR